MRELIKNPPKYQLDDGTIQVWSGMPKLPDVISEITGARDYRQEQERLREREKQSAEFERLEKDRKEHPERYFGIADVLKAIGEKKQNIKTIEHLAITENMSEILMGLDGGKREKELDKQRKLLEQKDASGEQGK